MKGEWEVKRLGTVVLFSLNLISNRTGVIAEAYGSYWYCVPGVIMLSERKSAVDGRVHRYPRHVLGYFWSIFILLL